MRIETKPRGASTRGVDYWRGGAGNEDRRIFSIRGEYLYALDATTGVPVQTFGAQGRVLLRFADRQPLAGRFNDSTGPLVVGNVVVVTGNTGGAGDGGNTKEAAPEDVRGFDAESGRLLWTFHVVPQPGEFGNETWGNGSWKIAGDLGAWNPMTADEELGYVYVPLTSPTAAWYGGWRPGNNLFANSIVALDVKTGKRVWHFQTVHHDLWDWDNIGPPMLGEITVDGKRIKAVMQANKAAFLYVLDRTNGRPVWPIEERPVPQSTVPGEHSSPTQPFPTKPPPFDLQGISDDDLIDYTPALKQRARTIASQYVMGPSSRRRRFRAIGGKKGTLVQPGAWGSANWNTGAFDPDTGYYYAISQTLGPANRSRTEADRSARDDGVRRLRADPGDRSTGVTGAAVDGRRHQHRRPADYQRALRSNHGDRSQSRRPRLDAAQRRRTAIPSVVEGSQAASARLSEPSGAAPHEDVAVSRRRQRRDQRNRRRRLDLGNEVPRLRQGDRQRDLGNGFAVRNDRRTDDLPAQRQAVHRGGGRRAKSSSPSTCALSLP